MCITKTHYINADKLVQLPNAIVTVIFNEQCIEPAFTFAFFNAHKQNAATLQYF